MTDKTAVTESMLEIAVNATGADGHDLAGFELVQDQDGCPTWNNKGECGYLFDNKGVQVSQRCY